LPPANGPAGQNDNPTEAFRLWPLKPERVSKS
jgi:hypothetical protein